MIYLSELWDWMKRRLPYWGIPALLLLVGAIILAVQVSAHDEGGPTTYQVKELGWHYTSGDDPEPASSSSDAINHGGATLRIPAPGTTDAATPSTASSSSSTSGVPSSSNLSNGGAIPAGNPTVVFKCYGRAHGVGLCMDGVRYRAEGGQSHAGIINYYYTGVQLGQIDDGRPIRVKGRDGAVRSMPMRDYLKRLTEEPEDYPAEGLKVLYIAARTYTLSCINRNKHANAGYDICSSGECCQAFNENKDISKSPNNCAAVDATEGLVLLFDGQPITAAYCGSCGGHTENNEDVWGSAAIPYLRGKPDTYCSKSPRFCTVVELPLSQLQSKLGVSGLSSIDLSDRTPGGRVRNAKFTSASGQKTMTGKQLAQMFGFRTPRIECTFR